MFTTESKRYEKIRNAENVAHRRRMSAEDEYVEMYCKVRHLVARVNYDFNSHSKDFDGFLTVRGEQSPFLEMQREKSDEQQRGVYHFYDMATAARSKGQSQKADSFVNKAVRCQNARDNHSDAIAQAESAMDAAMGKVRKGSPMANLSKLIRAVFIWRRAERKLRHYEAKEGRLGAKKLKMAAKLDARLEAEDHTEHGIIEVKPANVC